MLDGTGLGTAYQRLEQSFTVAGDVKVYVYERTRDLTRAEYQTIADRLSAHYPDYAQMYQVPDGFGT